MATLGQAYVQIMPSAKGISGSIQKIINPEATSAGKSAGTSIASSMANSMGNMGSTLTKRITLPVAGAATAIGGLVGALGFKRLIGLDTAQAKLKGLGYSGKEVERISGQVENAIAGGMTTMGEGVDIAAGGLAAGVKEGKDLEKYISLVGDAAVGANRPVDEMAQIFNRVQGGGRLMTRELNMIEMGLPGFAQAMADEVAGGSLESFRKMVTNGEVGSDDFLNVMDDFAGGMAAAYSESWAGMTKNTLAYVGIIGEALLEGLFEDGKAGLAKFIEVLKSDSLQDWATETGEKIRSFAQDVVGFVGELKGVWDSLSPGIQSFVAKLALVGGVFLTLLGPALSVISFLVKGFTSVSTVVTKLMPLFRMVGAVIGGISIPVALIVAAIIAAAVLIYVYWEPIKEFFMNLWESIKEITLSVWESIQEAWQSAVEFLSILWEPIGEFFTELWEIIKEIFMIVWEPIQEAWAEVVETFKELWTGISEFFMELWETIKEIFLIVWEPIKEAWTELISFIMELWGPISEFFAEMWTEIIEIFSMAWELITVMFQTVWAFIQPIVQLGMQTIALIISTVFGFIKEVITMAWNAIKVIFTAALSIIQPLVTSAFNIIKTIISTVMNVISAVISTVWNVIKTVITTVMNVIMTVIRTVWNVIKGIIQLSMSLIKGDISGVWNAILSIISSVLSGISSIISSVWSAILSIISSVMSGISSTISSVWSGILSIISSVVNGIKSTISGVFNALAGIVTGAMSGVKNAVSSGIKGALNVVTNIGGKFKEAGTKIVTSIADGIKGAVGKVTGAISNVMSKVRDFLPFSPPKTGPLIDIMDVEWGETIGAGISKGGNYVEKAMDEILDFDLAKKANFNNSNGVGNSQNRNNQPIILEIDGKQFAQITGDYTSVEGGKRIRKIERGLAT